jgi:hypothetical protein
MSAQPQPAQHSDRQALPPRLLRTRDAARYLGMSAWGLRQEVQRGELPYISNGEHTSAWRFDVRDLDRWIDDHRIGPK